MIRKGFKKESCKTCGRLPNWAQLGGNKDMIAPEAKVKEEGKSTPRYKGPQSIYLVKTHKKGKVVKSFHICPQISLVPIYTSTGQELPAADARSKVLRPVSKDFFKQTRSVLSQADTQGRKEA